MRHRFLRPAVALLVPLGLVLAAPAARSQAASPAAAATADAETFPRRKAGLWEVRSAAAQGHGLAPTRYCLGEQADQPRNHLDRQVGTRGACTLGAFQRAGGAWVAESVCKEGRTNVVSKAIASGDFEAEYRIDTLVSYDPPLGGVKREDKEAVVARWLGPCPAHHKPGDMIVPGLGTLNMIDGTFRAEPAPAAAPAPRRRKAAAD